MALNFKFYKDNREFINEEAEWRNPNKGKWLARVHPIGTLNLEQIAEKVSYSTTLTPADAFAACKAFLQVIHDGVVEGNKVVLDGIGSFVGAISCKGADSLDKFTVAKNVTGMHIVFRPAYSRDPATGKKSVNMLRGARVKELPKNAVV